MEEFMQTNTMTLTLDTVNVELPTQKSVPSIQEHAEVNMAELTPEEAKMVEDFSKKIDLTNSAVILQYGTGAQKKMADFSGKALENVKSKDLGEIGDLLNGVVVELRSFDEEEKKGILGIFRKPANKITAMKAKYAQTETNIKDVVKVLESHQAKLLKDISTLDKMYDVNLSYFKELSMYILAGRKKLEEVRTTQLAQLLDKARKSGLPEDAQAARDLDSVCNRFDQKLHDLELTRMISLQTAPQIRLIQNNDTLMVEKLQSTVVNTIPLWKSQMFITLGIEHSTQAAAAQRQVTDLTNELLKKNAQKLKMATVETAKETERGIVDIETLKSTNEMLISTLDEVLAIQQEGRQKRKEAEIELRGMEDQLKNRLLQVQAE